MVINTKSLRLSYLDINNKTLEVNVDRYPDQCPVCESGVDVKPLSAYGKIEDNPWRDGKFIQVIFRCPKVDCQSVFFAVYTNLGCVDGRFSENVFLKNGYISPFIKTEAFDSDIEKLSPNFIKIFNQAKLADQSGLDLICGAGYRKALEFLIKDFLIATKPDEAEEIKSKLLGWLIANKVDDPRIKITAGLAKDVGNDETHYEKKLDKLGIDDMRKLVKLTQYWIASEIMTTGYSKKN